MKVRISRLITQAPRTLPTAMSGWSASPTALSPVTSSGSEVTVASRTIPTQVRLAPVFSAIASP
jgi:hypothetical protein